MSNDDVANFIVENVVKLLEANPSSEEMDKVWQNWPSFSDVAFHLLQVLNEAAQKLVKHATDDLHSGDNTTAIIVALNPSKSLDKSQ